jgi:FHA domain-containing protein
MGSAVRGVSLFARVGAAGVCGGERDGYDGYVPRPARVRDARPATRIARYRRLPAVSPPDALDTNDDSLRAPEPVARRVPQLVVALECDRPLAGAARFSLAHVHPVRTGRGATREATRVTDQGYTTLHVRLPARSMSAMHARLVRAQGRWVLEHASSRNGSFVNGQRVTRGVLGYEDIADGGHALLLVRDRVNMCEAPADLDGADLRDEPHGCRTLVPEIAHELSALKRPAPPRVSLSLARSEAPNRHRRHGAPPGPSYDAIAVGAYRRATSPRTYALKQ